MSRGYNPSMRRSTRLALVIGGLLLVVAAGAYSAFWFIVAGQVAAGLDSWAQSMRAHNLDLSWREVGVRGFPFAFRIEMTDAKLHDQTPAFTGDVQAPVLSASASPWNFFLWRLTAPQGLTAQGGTAAVPAARLSAREAGGAVVVQDGEGATLWFSVGDVAADATVHMAAKQVYLWLIFPARPPQTHTDAAVAAALDAWGVSLPVVPPPLHNPIDELAFGVTVKGRLPTTSPRQAAEAWRDDGGTVDLDQFKLRWGGLAIRASGTLALDDALQPTGALSGGVEGYPELMRALVAAGKVRRGDADIADMALSLLAKTGPDGRPEIATSFSLQDGQMFLGPAKLGPIPHISW